MSVAKLPNGKWQVSFSLNGKRLRRNFESKAKAQTFADQVRFEKIGLSGIQEKYSIKEAFANYLEIDSKQKIGKSQKSDERFLKIATHFFKERQRSLVEEIRVEDLQHFEMWLGEPQKCGPIVKPKWSQTSIARQCKVLKTIMKKAFHTGKIGRNPAEVWRIRGGNSAKRRPMTMAEFKIIYDLAPEWYKPILRTLALTGVRPVALADLKWSDINWDKATVRISSRKGGSLKMKTILIPMLPELAKLLAIESQKITWRQAEGTQPISEFVFERMGEPISAQLISKTGSRLISRAGLSGVVLYGLRHALATDLLEAGVDSEIARRILGHSDLRMLQEYTSHLGTGELNKAMQLVRGAPVDSDEVGSPTLEDEDQDEDH